ncbi:hypothetical protein D9757_009569 [Collybiopsis confluens]|uniref:Uncharacterized protein n=1 Tax=Collybiopsis confluens TaxID=2823264 RepID=A0A8H5H4I6_9AGAR|nr:hypothetical protein D9757_012345 [Collybiopsis confluens]KAF5376624.1 hypothetical protein D9757_009569 [Collybiopsis confluens]
MAHLWQWDIGFVLVLVVLLRHLGKRLRHRFLLRQTCVEDLKRLGQSRPENTKLKGTAVVCGGSIGGLLAARVCHDHFARVIIVEPESWLGTEDATRKDAWKQEHSRTRVVQYHSLQGEKSGLCCLFPNFVEECIASDIHVCRGDFRSSTWGNWTRTPYAEYQGELPKTMFVGRPGLETLLRRLVFTSGNFPNITQVIGTAFGMTRSTSTANILEEVMACDPNRSGLKWLQREGFGHSIDGKYVKEALPLEDLRISYDQKIHYSTLAFRVTKELGERLDVPGGWENCGPIYNCFTDSEVENRSIYSQRIEGDIVQLCCGAWGVANLPTTLEDVKSYVKSLVTDKPIPEWFFKILDLLGEVEDTVTCSKVRVSPSHFVQFHKAVNLPSNWIALGDSVMRVNPVFGKVSLNILNALKADVFLLLSQGCTKALMGAICLNTVLHETDDIILEKFSRDFFELQADKITPIWEGVKIGDYAYKTTIPVQGETLSKGTLLRWYIRKLHILAFTDKQAGSALWHVKMFLAPSIDYLQFGLILKVLGNFLLHPNA